MPPKLSFVWCFPRILFSNWLLLITLCSCSLRMALVNEYLHFHFNLIWETLAFNWWKHELRFVLHTNLFGFVPTILLCALFCLPFCFLSFFSLFVHNIGSHWFYWIYFSPFPPLKRVKVAQLCQTLWDSMGCGLPGSSVHEIPQGRVREWVAILFSRGSSQPRDQIQVSHTAGRFFTIWATREAPFWKLYIFTPFFFSKWFILYL